jgi:hypothetical protein
MHKARDFDMFLHVCHLHPHGDVLQGVHDEIQSLYRVFASNPLFGIELSVEERSAPVEQLKVV